MKLKELEKILQDNKFLLKRTSKHRIYSNGRKNIIVPNKKELNFKLCLNLLKSIHDTKKFF